MINYREESKESFDELSTTEKEKVMEIVAHYHIRNGNIQPDGSMGEIRITPKQLNDLLAFLLGNNPRKGLKYNKYNII